MRNKSRIAFKYVNVMDRVREPQRSFTPVVAVVQEVPNDVDLALIPSPGSTLFLEWSDLSLRHVAGLDLRGECE